MKPVSAFGRRADRLDGLATTCKPCYVLRHRKYDRRRTDYSLQLNYGITMREYEALERKQNGQCAICGQPETRVFKGKLMRLAVDHDHATGAIRGLLCCACNHGIGLLKEDAGLLEAAARYLRGFS